MLLSDACDHCGQTIAASEPQLLGYCVAVHLHDEHPDEFEELAEDARRMNAEAESVVEDHEPGVVDQLMDSVLDQQEGGE